MQKGPVNLVAFTGPEQNNFSVLYEKAPKGFMTIFVRMSPIVLV